MIGDAFCDADSLPLEQTRFTEEPFDGNDSQSQTDLGWLESVCWRWKAPYPITRTLSHQVYSIPPYLICIDRVGSIFLTAIIHTNVCHRFIDTVNQYYIKCYLQFTLNCLK